MLPKHVIDLLGGFAQVFDSERPAEAEFRKAHTRAAEQQVQRGSRGLNAFFFVPMLQNLDSYLHDRTKFIWVKLQDVISLTEVEPYPDLAADMKNQIATQYNPTRAAAVQYLEKLRQGLGHSVEVQTAFANIPARINAEIDLFCAAYAARQKQANQNGGPILKNFAGIYGDVTNSQVTLYDFGSICNVVKDHGIPGDDLNELEDIMDALKTAPADSIPHLLERREKWLVKHKDALGASAEFIAKVISE